MLAGARQWTQHGRPEFFAVWLPSVEHIAAQTQWKRSKVRWHRLEEVTTWCQRQGRRLRLQTFNSADGTPSPRMTTAAVRVPARLRGSGPLAVASTAPGHSPSHRLFLRREAAVAGLLTDESIFGHRRPVRALERQAVLAHASRALPRQREDVAAGRRLRPQ